jgi:hypothetical protein
MQHSLRLQKYEYTVSTWPLMVRSRACFVRSNLKYASRIRFLEGSLELNRVKKIWHNLDAGYVLLRNKECQTQRRQLSYSPFYTGTLKGGWGVQLRHQTIFFLPTCVSFLSFLHSFPTSFTIAFLLSFSLSFTFSYACFSLLLSRRPFISLVYEPCLIFYSLFLPTFAWLGFSLVRRRF